MATLNTLTQNVILQLSQVPGTAVQIYAEARIQAKIQQLLDTLYLRRFWSEFRFANTWTLSGTTGLVTDDVSAILLSPRDIAAIFPSNGDKQLIDLPLLTNPTLITGTRPRFVEKATVSNKPFRIWPLTSTGTIVVIGRTPHATLSPETEINFDNTVLELGAVYDYLEDDATNPGQIEKYQKLFEGRLRELENNDEADSLPLSSPTRSTIPNQWFVQ